MDERNRSLCALHSKCRWTIQARFDVMVFVQALPQNDDLTQARIAQDLDQLPHRIDQLYPGGCPPFGFARGRLVILVYLLDAGMVEHGALQRIMAPPAKQWCATTFLAAQDGNGESYFYDEKDGTPFWGRALFPEMRYWAGLLTGRSVPKDPPSLPTWIVWLNVLLIPFILFQFYLEPMFLVHFLIIMAIGFLVAWICDCWARRRRHPKSNQEALLTDDHDP